MILRALKPQYQENAMRWLQATALFALSIGILLPKIFHGQIAANLISGIMLGYSIVGNLFSLYYRTHKSGKSS